MKINESLLSMIFGIVTVLIIGIGVFMIYRKPVTVRTCDDYADYQLNQLPAKCYQYFTEAK